MYGIAEPVRRGMELKNVRDGDFRPAVLGGSKLGSVHEDILVLGGRDCEIGWEDVFLGMFSPFPVFISFSGFGLSGTGRTTTDVGILGDEFREPPSFHDEMEKRLRMDW